MSLVMKHLQRFLGALFNLSAMTRAVCLLRPSRVGESCREISADPLLYAAIPMLRASRLSVVVDAATVANHDLKLNRLVLEVNRFFALPQKQ